jgi:two-component system chemotaxis response regulator CheY
MTRATAGPVLCRPRRTGKYILRQTWSQPLSFALSLSMSIPAKILIVDDQAFVRRNLRSLLSEQPHWDIYDVDSGARALERIRGIRPDVVVLDLVMPEMNGIELAYEIRQLDGPPKIVLISSHYTPEEAAVLARLFGDGNFISKSEAGEKLIPAISRLLPKECQAKARTV